MIVFGPVFLPSQYGISPGSTPGLARINLEVREMEQNKHTPIPWTVEPSVDNYGVYYIAEADDQTNLVDNPTEIDNANAEFIVRAVNNYYDLLEMVRKLNYGYLRGSRMSRAEKDEIFMEAQVLITKATK